MLRRTHKPDVVALSALADGALAPAEAAALESHVAGCDVCRSRLGELRSVRAMLRAMPEADAPRSFRLRRADVEAAAKRGPSPLWYRAMPALSAAALVMFATLVMLDASTNGEDGAGPMAMTAAEDKGAAEMRRNAGAPLAEGAGAGTTADGDAGAEADPPQGAAGSSAGDDGAPYSASPAPERETLQEDGFAEAMADDDDAPGAMRIAQWSMLALAAAAAMVAAAAWWKRRERS